MTGLGAEIAAVPGGRGHLRASHADRELVVGILKSAFVQGMLAKDEFDLRVGHALVSRTCAERPPSPLTCPPGWPRRCRPSPPGPEVGSQFCGRAR